VVSQETKQLTKRVLAKSLLIASIDTVSGGAIDTVESAVGIGGNPAIEQSSHNSEAVTEQAQDQQRLILLGSHATKTK
jgi:hypothetical protein